MGRLLFIIKMDNLKAWVILLKGLPMDLLLYMIVMVMNCIEGCLKMVNLQESGFLQTQKTMKKQLNLIKNSLYHF